MNDQHTRHGILLQEIRWDLAGEPSFPTCMDAAVLVRDTLKDPEVSLDKVVQVVSIEPLISSKVLRLANAAAYNPAGRPITKLNEAVSRLGFETVRTISLAVALDQMLRLPNMAAFAPLAKNAWEHSLCVAAIGRVLARRMGNVSPDEAMLAGLVHDIGVFYLLYRATKHPQYSAEPPLLMSLLKGWHAAIGEQLLRALGLPERIIVTLHTPLHSLPDAVPCELFDVVYFADKLSNIHTPWNENEESSDYASTEQQSDKTRYADLLEEANADIRQLHSALAS
jgi:HD-like signal output (HDOD) protein